MPLFFQVALAARFRVDSWMPMLFLFRLPFPFLQRHNTRKNHLMPTRSLCSWKIWAVEVLKMHWNSGFKKNIPRVNPPFSGGTTAAVFGSTLRRVMVFYQPTNQPTNQPKSDDMKPAAKMHTIQQSCQQDLRGLRGKKAIPSFLPCLVSEVFSRDFEHPPGRWDPRKKNKQLYNG